MGRTTAKTKPLICTNCAGTALVRRITTYPVRLTAPAPLIGKEIHVHRVALHECQSCGYLMPTPAGQAKVTRCVQRGIDFFLGRLR